LQILPILKGAATYIPWLYRAESGATGGTATGRYCYSAWLRHLRVLADANVGISFGRVAELGPGDSIGIGLAAMLTGACHLESLDVVRYASAGRNKAILAELVKLFGNREPIPGAIEFPQLQPRLRTYAFPEDLLPDALLVRTLDAGRLERIERAIDGFSSDVSVVYRVPWYEQAVEFDEKLDLVYSQAVLEHVEDLQGTHLMLAARVRPGGVACHVIDFRSHRITPEWDGHLQYPPQLWRLVKGRRPYLLNRAAPSDHLQALEAAGFRILAVERVLLEPTVPYRKLARIYRRRTAEDRETATMTVIARLERTLAK
jgi:hypothetical protein